MPHRLSAAERAHEDDCAWFHANPTRSIRTRPSLRNERPEHGANWHNEWPLMLVVRTITDRIERRQMRGDPKNVPDNEQFLWGLWSEILQQEALFGRDRQWNITPARHATLLREAGAL